MKKGIISAQNYIYLYPLAAIALVLMLSWLLVVPQARRAKEIYDGLSVKEERLEILEQKRQTLAAIDEATLNTLSDVTLALPNEKDPASIMVGIDNLSAQSKLFIDNLEFSPLTVNEATGSKSLVQSPESRPASAVEFTTTTRGTTQNFHDFVSQLQGSRRLMDIDSIDITFQAEGGDFVNAGMKLVAFYLVPLTQIGEVESRLPAITAEEKQTLSTIGNLPYISSQPVPLDQADSGFVAKTDLFAP